MPKKTLQSIIDRKCHYVIKVKANQRRLLEQLHLTCACPAEDVSQSSKRHKGRSKHRQVEVYKALEEAAANWPALNTFLKVGSRGKVAYRKVSYYISDLQGQASGFAAGIQGHWAIENKLHWVKDALLAEDKNKAKKGNGPAVLSLIRGFAIRALAKSTLPVLQTIRMVTNKPSKILELLE
ncbi:ISAs1 family transposase [Pontibacter pudoricolor]|uniref:ISAs1 family transposase n=1 Tax=Pontibacter pudoricolor TaxID=2694930 RepID=UPI0013916C3C|nr:ISAs1 family transposase [Pontibacter pudoricolor]